MRGSHRISRHPERRGGRLTLRVTVLALLAVAVLGQPAHAAYAATDPEPAPAPAEPVRTAIETVSAGITDLCC